MVPSLVYVLGVPSFMAVGTDLFQIVFTAAFGSLRHIISGNIVYVFVLLLGSAVGVRFGALATRYLKGVCMRLVLATTILVTVGGSACQLVNSLTGGADDWLQIATVVVTFGGLAPATLMIIGLLIAGIRYSHNDRFNGSDHRFFKVKAG